MELREALAHIKRNAESYLEESKAASSTLTRLTNSLSLLRGLKIYQQTDALAAKPISELEFSVRTGNCLERLRITTLASVCKHTAHKLLKDKNAGQMVLEEIRAKLSNLGLHLRGE